MSFLHVFVAVRNAHVSERVFIISYVQISSHNIHMHMKDQFNSVDSRNDIVVIITFFLFLLSLSSFYFVVVVFLDGK